MTIGIIGGGASGMAAALAAAENENARVILLERQTRLGKKLSATGNGRCNLSNLEGARLTHYHGEDPDFCACALSAFPPEAVTAWFRKLGLLTAPEDNRIYPFSNQANSVVDILRFALEKPNIQVITGFEVTKVKKTAAGFSVTNSEEAVLCDKLIIACGGIAGSKLGGTMSGYKLLGKLGHRCTKLRPALVQLKTDWKGIVALKGVRAECDVQIFHNGNLFARKAGEVQLTELGVSGPVIFDISRDVCQEKGDWLCRLDFLPGYSEDFLLELLDSRRETSLLTDELLTGILHNRLGRVVTKTAGISSGQRIRDLTDADLLAVCKAAKAFEIGLTEPLGMDSAQVTAGGVYTCEFDETTMESRLVPGLYACGEVLDIDGDCGGFNLQWAWSSGRLAGLSAGKDIV